MSNIVIFKPRVELTAKENLENFIDLAKNRIQLWSSGGGFKWEHNQWPTHFKSIRFLSFENRQLHHTKPTPPEICLLEPYLDFAKAYLRYTQNIKQTKTYSRTISALIFLEKAMRNLDGKSNITRAAPRHFTEACNLILKEKMKDKTGIGIELKRLADNISKFGITVHATKTWVHPFFGKNANESSLNTGSAKARKEKLPDDDALLALAEIFSNGYTGMQDDEDTYVSCHTCILLSAPQRISEGRWYRTNLLVTENDSLGNPQLYLSYWVSKNAKYVRKEVPKTMAEHTKESVKRLLKMTKEGRELAWHYESNRTQFYRHKDCPDVDDDEILSVEQITQALGLKNRKACEDFIRKESGSYSLTTWTLNRLWKEVVLPKHKRLNPYFPYQVPPSEQGIGKTPKMSESLLCFRYLQLSGYKKTSPILLVPFNRDYYAKRLEYREIKRGKKIVNMSIFLKNGYGNLSLRSHQCRHFLNTLAQEAGIGIEAITTWSTRVSQRQSRVYMHQDPLDKAKNIASQSEHEILQPEPVSEDEYALMDKGAVINTRYGVCSHDYTLTPCQKHAECLDCSELLVCKGHQKTIDAIKDEYSKLTENLMAAKAQIEAGRQVASRWYEFHTEKYDRLTELLSIIDTSSVENGSIIKQVGSDFSHQQRIIAEKIGKNHYKLVEGSELETKYGKNVMACLDILREEIDE
ncbi:hypothetical protein ACEUKD_11040 [Vibrio diabolicus]|uniref:hypothetical protein n=1 Tax=Vibrio TaxID=662 RepID=UPI002964C652|nr:hypothetical protein [Vibrio sp. Vb1574]MDW1887589.1 hypothetical protein [Vibrio sp. Vb1574]